MILFDTSILSRVFRRRRLGPLEQRLREKVEHLLNGELPLGLPSLVLQEVLSGLRSPRQFADLERKLLASFVVLLPSAADHVTAARLHNKCLSTGLSVSGPDCLIAVTAIAGDHELFTADSDFEAIARIAPLKLFRDEP